jgi:hypothetical protein
MGPLRLGGITTGSHRVGVLGGILAADSSNKVWNSSLTFNDSPSTAQLGAKFGFTGAGSAGYQQQGVAFEIGAGYTGGAATISLSAINHSAGTGNSFANVGTGNVGIQLYSDATTTGMNAGFFAQAANGTRSIGGVGMAVTTKNSGTNIGLVGIGLNAGSSPVQVGVYAGLTTAAAPGVPTTSAALVANNGATSDPVARFQVAGVDKVTIDATGLPIFAVTSTPASNAACTAGTITWDASYVYVCTASGAWKRAALTGGY